MSADDRLQQLACRVQDLYATDPEFAAAAPDLDACKAITKPGLRLADIVRILSERYADRPALGQRAVKFVQDAAGRTSTQLLPAFDTITYRQLWDRAVAISSALGSHPVQPGDRVCTLGFTSVDYTVVEAALVLLGAVSVPLQASAPLPQLISITDETEPVVIAAGVDYLPTAIEIALRGGATARVVVFDYRAEVDEHRESLAAARAQLADAGSPVAVEPIGEVIERGASQPASAPRSDDDDPLSLIVYTSGSTGTPKGAMHLEHLVAMNWQSPARATLQRGHGIPSIALNFLPLSHVGGRGMLFGVLGTGGTAYFAAKSDISTLLEDIALVRPTQLNLVPRVWDMLFQQYQNQLDLRCTDGTDPATVESQVKADLRQNLLGGRYVTVRTGSAPISPELANWVESFTGTHLMDSLGSTESGSVVVDGRVVRPLVIDYKLLDVPELGYFSTDRPHPRGELAVKSHSMFAGYYKRPDVTAEVFDSDGFYRTGDIVADIGPDELVYVDRRNNVIKLSQGEFVTISKLEAVFVDSPLVSQIFVYGNSARPYLLAVVVPSPEAVARSDTASLKATIGQSLRDVAATAGLQSYEIPRDFIIETTPFTLENELLTGISKLARPKLLDRYGSKLEQLYTELARGQVDELRTLRDSGADLPTLQTITRAARALLGASGADVQAGAHFTDLGGDSLSALTFANLLRDIFEIDVPVGTIVSPANDLQALAEFIDAAKQPGNHRASFASVHGAGADQIRAADLTLEKFIDGATLQTATTLPSPGDEVRAVLLTGVTGFLGRFLVLQWLERLAPVGGTLVCLVRAKDDVAARERLDQIFHSGDPELLAHYRHLAAGHLQVVAGDKGQPKLGLDHKVWQRLAHTVDAIVDPAALVNHLLPYDQLFEPNVVGTAELIRLALTTKLKPYTYVSTLGVGMQIKPSAFTEDADIRSSSPVRVVDDCYANGYANSKWAGEVLLREAHERYGLPVAVFRSNMIMTDTRYSGQLNLPDTFTRLILSLAATGIAPGSFYQRDADGNRQRTHYDGLPVDFIAQAITTLGQRGGGFRTYHVTNPHDDGLGLDEYVDWLIEAGYPITRIPDYDSWYQRFETAVRSLPEKQRQSSVLPLLDAYRQPQTPMNQSFAPVDRFRAAVRENGVGSDKDIPHISAPIIVKYITNLQLLGLL
jgi:fatty acid CoA ligase FadD9